MSAYTIEQRKAFSDARQLIDLNRAREIVQLKNWQHGMCGCSNATKPDFPAVTDEEYKAIEKLWLALPWRTSWMSALYLLQKYASID